jgi:hypothetical protein
MNILSSILRDADVLARKEIKKYNSPAPNHYDLANENGQRLAKKYKADVTLVGIGTRLMDVKIGQAIKMGKLDKHIEMSSLFAKKFLSKYNVSDELRDKIINCIEAHHNTTPYTCLEAEVCANADCYRMLTPEGAITLLVSLSSGRFEFKKALDYLDMKVDEKWRILSLRASKKELTPNYKLLKKLLTAR